MGCWLRHLETVLASRLRSSPVLEYDRDLLQLPSGGTVALDFESLKEVSAMCRLLEISAFVFLSFQARPG